MEVLRQMQQSQDEKFRVLADENKNIKSKFIELSKQVAYEANYMASTVDLAARESQPISTLQDLVPADALSLMVHPNMSPHFATRSAPCLGWLLNGSPTLFKPSTTLAT